MGAAGTMPGELHKIWDAAQGGYHMEYGFSCMGYEIAGALWASRWRGPMRMWSAWWAMAAT
jgi:TPP-dependent trihydroxycyclohexane-1,2-dione (THcHDO) dehydratase